jgi:telomerase Cajal body protein 1
MDSGKMMTIKLMLQSTGEIEGHMGGFNDFDWYPWMSSSLQGSDLFLTSSKDLPIQLWSSGEGKVVCSWTAKDHLDQVANCLSVSFSSDGQKIVSGGQDKIWIFNTNRPGANAVCEFQTIPNKKSKKGQKGLISCLNFRYDDTGVFAAGSFKGSVGIYDSRTLSDRNSSCICLFEAHKNGVSQAKFLNDGWSILTAGRRDNSLKKWDLRMTQHGDPITKFTVNDYPRSNQRIYFDISSDGKLFTGSSESLFEFQLSTGELINETHIGNTVSSVSSSISKKLAFSTGCRKFQIDDSESEDHESNLGSVVAFMNMN